MIANVNLQPATDLENMLSQTVWRIGRQQETLAWRACFCALVPILNPHCKTYKVAEALPSETERFDKIDFLNAMANLGYFANSARLSIDEIDERLMPCLFIPSERQDEPCLVLGKDSIYAGRQKDVICAADNTGHGEAWFFEPFHEDKAPTSKNMRAGTGHSWFRALLGRFSGTFWQVLTTGFFLNLMALGTPLFIMVVYDRVIAADAGDILPMLVLGVTAGLVIEWKLRTLRSTHLSCLAARLDNIVSNQIFSHLLHLSPSYIERASVPSQVARIKTFESVRDFFSGSVFLSLLELPFMVVALIAIGIIAGPLVFVPIVMSLLYLALFFITWRHVKVAIRSSAKSASVRQQFVLETIDKLESINSNGLGEAWARKYQAVAARDALMAFRLSWLGTLGETLANALTVLSAVAVVGFGVELIWSGTMTTGALVATMILVWRILTPFYSLCAMIPRLDQLRNSVRQVNMLMDIETEDTTHKNSARLEKIRGRISFINVGLRYATDGDALFSNLTFEAMPGDIVAITGNNGSGKTSLLKLVKNMYAPQSGSIRIDGFDIRQLNPSDLRRRIAYIPQQTSFFHGTVAENLRFSNPLVSTREMEIALGQAGALEEINALPQGLNTLIGGDSKQRLSSSLELRLSMVRAYLHDAPILLIDELPNSLLSDEAGVFLRDHLIRHKKRHTVLMVTHREDFMQLADTIVMLQRGFPPQVGPRQFMLDRLHKEQW